MIGVGVLLAGGLITWWTVFQSDRNMRDELRRQTSRVVQGLNLERVQELTGKESDLRNPSYLRVKEQLASVRSFNPQCRFLYLIGRKLDGACPGMGNRGRQRERR